MKSEARLGDSAATMERTVDEGADIGSKHGRQYVAPDEPCPWLAPRNHGWRSRLYRPFVADHRPDPVSYTHLRAHETDSYLVCRLLLEKKKKNHETCSSK